jgi:hypothetical protein
MGGMPDLESGHLNVFHAQRWNSLSLQIPKPCHSEAQRGICFLAAAEMLHTDEQIPQWLIAVSE